MKKTLTKIKGHGLPAVCCCSFVLFWHMTSALASSTNSSGTVTSGEYTGDESSTTMERGMRPFFDMVKSFLGIVQPNQITDQSWLNLSEFYRNGEVHLDQFEDWQNWTKYLVGFVVCAAVGVLFFIAMPITGCIFCCCRCCGKCGGRTKQHDPKHAGCKRTSYCTLVLLLNTVTLAGVICAFLSNQLVYEKLRNADNRGPVGKFTETLEHIDGFTNTTVDEIESSILNRFTSAKVQIIDDVRNTANEAVDDVLGNLNATSLIDQTRALSKVVNRTREELSNVAVQLVTLSTNGQWLAGNLTQIANTVDAFCGTTAQCGNYNRQKYRVNANFSDLNDLSSEAQKLANSVNLEAYIRQAEETIDRTKNTTTQSVNDGIDSATDSVNTVETNIRDGIADFRSKVHSSVLDETARVRRELKTTQADITKYSKYLWYGGLGVSSVLLCVVVLYYVGVLFGLCGERPGLGAQCCNTGTGANFLMAGVGFTFLLAWLVMLVCIILFLTGGPLYTELCRYFIRHDPHELKPFNTAVMQAVNFQKGLFGGKDINLNLVDILDGCQKNRPIYNLMKLENMVNLTQYTDLTPLRKELDNLKTATFNIPDITIITSDMNRTINDFATAGLDSIIFQDYYTEINRNLTAGDLHILANNLRNIAYQGSADTSFKVALLAKADELDTLDQTLVAQMKKAVKSLNTSLRFLETQADAKIRPATAALLNNLQTAQDNFNAKKTQLVKTQLDVVIERVLNVADDFIQQMMTDVYENIGQCRPIYDGFYSATDGVCIVVLEPLNGFWFSVGWCLFLCIPCLIFAVKLAGLYRREHDDKVFDDPNYIVYGRDQDTIPLTSMERGRHSAYPSASHGMANSAYRDSYLGPRDRYAPPPYGAHSHSAGSGEMTPPPYPL
ncbi:prominin-1-A-like isoform X2 [Babylonia areolata]|uniref:prominin-1-A-like isoform X2 n=1 Tax=Babylonia areolata TaxID=304850 RepID=UPI003FD361D2